MRFLRALLLLSLIVALGSAFAAAPSAGAANPACAQNMPDHNGDCGAGDVFAGGCSPVGCAQPAVTQDLGASVERFDAAGPTSYAATPLSSLALPPETAPPKHSRL